MEFLERYSSRLLAIIWLLTLAGMSLFLYAHDVQTQQHETQELSLLLKEASKSINSKINMFALGSKALRASLLSDDDSVVRPSQVRSFINHRDTEREFPGSRGFGFVRKIHPRDLKQQLQQGQRDPLYPKKVIQFEPHVGDVFLVEVIEPSSRNHSALGLDLASEPRRREAAMNSARSGYPGLTAPLKLLQINDPNAIGFLLLVPVYRDSDTPLISDRDREQHLIGWTYAALLIDDLLATAQLNREMMSLNIVDITEADKPQQVFGNPTVRMAKKNHPLTVEQVIELFGRQWRITAQATPSMMDSFERGHIHWVEILVFIVLLTAACVGISFFIKHHIEREKRHVEEIARRNENERRWRDLANYLPQMVWTCDKSGACDYLSSRWEQYTGIDAALQLGDNWAEQIHPDDKPALITLWKNAVNNRTVFCAEFRIRRFDGEYRWFDTRATPVFDESGSLIRWVGSNTDIQLQKAAQIALQHMNDQLEDVVQARTQELSKAERKTKKILDTVPLLIGYWDNNLMNVFANYAYEDWFGISRHHLPGMRLSDLLSPDSYQKALPHIQQVLRGVSQRFVNKFQDINGNGERYGLVSMLPDEIDGQIVGFFVCMQEVTELQMAREAAFVSSASKSRFMATIGHEIRNPLNGILGSSDIMLEELPDGPVKTQIARIKDSAKSIRIILDDLLDITGFESGRLRLEKIPFSLHETIRNAAPLYEPIALKKGVRFELDLNHAFDHILVNGDPTRLRQVLQNLISNAVKFTSKGRIVCSASIELDDTHHCMAHISIKDSGIGIAQDKLSTLFTPFVQADVSNFREYGGSGLGLSITKSLVEAMGGNIVVMSELGAGTEFLVTLPFECDVSGTVPAQANEASATSSPPAAPHDRQLNILVVDDAELNRVVLKKILMRDSHRVQVAASAKQALKECQNKSFDLIISDINMPDMSGLELTDALRKTAGLNQNTPILAFSGSADQDSIELAIEHGMNGHIAKPVNPDTLRQVVGRYAKATLSNAS